MWGKGARVYLRARLVRAVFFREMRACVCVVVRQFVWFYRDCLLAGVNGCKWVQETVAVMSYVYGDEHCANIFHHLQILFNFLYLKHLSYILSMIVNFLFLYL